jgi:hypothetical protein
MDAKEIILRNFPHNNLYDYLSFLGKLIEEYWLLEWGVYNLEKNSSEKLDWEIFKIFSLIMLSISSHLDQNGYFKIKNLKRSELYEMRERVLLVFEGYFSSSMPKQNIFEKVNPLVALPSI